MRGANADERNGDREAGFSLIETLVALAVIAAMSGVLFQAIGTSAQVSRQAERRREAVLVAQSLLAQTTVQGEQAIGAREGRWRGMRWRVDTRASAAGGSGSGPPLEEVLVDVADGETGRRLATARTLRLGRP